MQDALEEWHFLFSSGMSDPSFSSVRTREFHAVLVVLFNQCYMLLDLDWWGCKLNRERGRGRMRASLASLVSGKFERDVGTVPGGRRVRLSPLIPPVWWAPVHCRQSVRSAVLSVRRQDSSDVLSLCHSFLSIRSNTIQSNSIHTWRRKLMPVCLPPRLESSVTLFPLISDRGPAILLLFLAPPLRQD